MRHLVFVILKQVNSFQLQVRISYNEASLTERSRSNNVIIYVKNLLKIYHLFVSDTLYFMTYAFVILIYPLFS
jgi:hypothetical protein